MSEACVVTPEEAQEWPYPRKMFGASDLAHTVATEEKRWAERIAAAERAAVVKALLKAGVDIAEHGDLVSYETGRTIETFLERRAGAIENGADYA